MDLQEFTQVDAAEASAFHLALHKPVFDTLSPLTLPSEPPAAVWCHEGLPDHVLRPSHAVHEATHAVLGKIVGATPVHLELAPGRDTLVGGGFQSHFSQLDAQLATVIDLGAGPAQAAWLRQRGYVHPQLQQCVLEYCTMGDTANVDRRSAEDLIIDRAQARRDAERICNLPVVARATVALADLLLSQGRLNEQQIAGLLDGFQLPAPSTVWIPGRRLRTLVHPARAASCSEH